MFFIVKICMKPLIVLADNLISRTAIIFLQLFVDAQDFAAFIQKDNSI